MKKLLKVVIVGVFLTGILVSVVCLACSLRIAMSSCHDKNQPSSAGDDSCLSHCLKQKIFTVNIGNQLSVELKNQGAFYARDHAPVHLQTLLASQETNPACYIDHLVSNLNTGQIHFTPLFNHSPPLL